MAKALVVVESPAKAKTINRSLGRDYKVIASMGHIRDLPKSKLGVDVDNDFAEEHESIASRKKVIKELKDAAKDASDIYVATDPDREGEAIGWHLIEELKGKKRKIHRLTFNEITKKAIKVANGDQANAILAELEKATWTVASVATRERKRNPAPPFITSKLQQTARFPVKKTMMLAQQLYEGGIEIPGLAGGLITYMRTDSVRVAGEALAAVRDHVKRSFGDDYLPEKPNIFKSKAHAQDAHEAIRPTSPQH